MTPRIPYGAKVPVDGLLEGQARIDTVEFAALRGLGMPKPLIYTSSQQAKFGEQIRLDPTLATVDGNGVYLYGLLPRGDREHIGQLVSFHNYSSSTHRIRVQAHSGDAINGAQYQNMDSAWQVGIAQLVEEHVWSFISSGIGATGPSGPSGEHWTTGLDLDFSALPNQTLTADGAHTIGGLSWTKIGTAYEAAAAAIVNGSGLVLQPSTGTNYSGSTRTCVGILIPLTTLFSGFSVSTRARLWIRIAAENMAANYDTVFVAFDNPTTSHFCSTRVSKCWATSKRAHTGSTYDNTSYDVTHDATLTGGADVIVADSIGGRAGLGITYCGTWAAGWPAESGLLSCGRNGFTGSTVYDQCRIGTGADWNLLIGAYKVSSATAFSVTISNVRMDYVA